MVRHRQSYSRFCGKNLRSQRCTQNPGSAEDRRREHACSEQRDGDSSHSPLIASRGHREHAVRFAREFWRCEERSRKDLEGNLWNPILQTMKLVSRAPIVVINHKFGFIFGACYDARRRSQFIGLAAIGAYIALDLGVRGCVVVHGTSFWCKRTTTTVRIFFLLIQSEVGIPDHCIVALLHYTRISVFARRWLPHASSRSN